MVVSGQVEGEMSSAGVAGGGRALGELATGIVGGNTTVVGGEGVWPQAETSKAAAWIATLEKRRKVMTDSIITGGSTKADLLGKAPRRMLRPKT